jgi:hypothetical protein
LLLKTQTLKKMKRILLMTALVVLATLGGSLRNSASAQVNVDISYQNFYDELDPYGDWIDYPEYGYVWVPRESRGGGFRPYETNGHWVWTDDYEWMWVSDYSWGWAPFHYGRWFNDPYYGWVWVPGYEWSPAWVAWRDGGDYYGWAPLRPGFNISISIGSYNPPVDYWVFAPRRYISSPRIYDYCMDRGRNVTIINHTTIINNYGGNRRTNVYINGPRRNDAERYAGRINPVRFREASSASGSRFRNNEVSLYRPRVQQDNNRQYTPRTFNRYDGNNAERNNRFERGDNVTSRANGNNLPQQGDRNNRFERTNNDNGNNVPQEGSRSGRFERRNTNEGAQQGNVNNRRFERNSDNTPAETGRPSRSFGQREQPQVQQQNTEANRNVFERRNENRAQNENRTRRFEQRNNTEIRAQQPQQNPAFERRSAERNSPAPQVERQRPQQEQADQRRFERNSGNDGRGNGNGNGRGRRG